MRVLMLQAVDGTSTDLSGLSEWNYHLDIMRALARRETPVYFYVAVPKKRADLTYPDSMFDLPNVKLLPYEHRGTFLMADEWLKWLNAGTNLVPFDVVWNDCWWFNVTVAVGLIRGVVGGAPALVNSFYQEPRTKDMRLFSGFPLVDLQMFGGALHDHTVVLTPFHRSQMLEIGREYLSATMLRRLDERIGILPPAADAAIVSERTRPVRAKGETIVVMASGGLVESKRRLPDIARVVKKLRDLGYPIKMLVTTQSPPTKRRGAELESLGVEVRYGCQRREFLAALNEADVYVDATTDISTGLASIEAVFARLPLVVIRRPWMDGRIPDEYQLSVDGWDGLETVLAIASKNHAEFTHLFQAEIDLLYDHFMQTFSSDAVADRFMDALRSAVACVEATEPVKVSRSFMELVTQAAEGLERITLPQLYEGMRKHSRSASIDWSVGQKHWNGFIARRALERLGFEDLCDGPEPVLVRRAGWS